MPDPKTNVNTPTRDFEEMERKRWLCRVLMVGTGATDEPGSFLAEHLKLLPRYSSEFDADYEFRRDHLTTVPPDFPDAVDAVVAAILNGPLAFDDADPAFWNPETKQGDWNNIDRAGRRGDAFLAAVATESIAEALPAVFVDYWTPKRTGDDEPRSREDTIKTGRPYWTHIHAGQIIELQHVDGLLVRCRWRESVAEADGDWGVKMVNRVRVLFRGDPKIGRDDETKARYARWETWRENPEADAHEKDKWIRQEEPLFTGDQPDGFLSPPDGLSNDQMDEFMEIPLYLYYSGYRRQGVAWPILRHQAEMIRLWSLMHSDFASAQHYAANPRDVVVGTNEETYADHNPGSTAAGKGNLTFLPRGTKWEIAEHGGNSFGSLQAFLDKLEEKIRQAGIETLRQPATGRELATLGLLEREKKLTRLEVVGLFWQDAFGSCLRRDELLRGRDPKAKAVFPEPNKDLLVSPQAQLKVLEVSAAHDLADPKTFWMLARSITGNEDIDPEKITEQLLEFQRSGAGAL
ncbi:MAG: DUF4055 domain-containing protein [Acidobacteriota bacterium]